MSDRNVEASALFLTHGPGDALTTILASRAVGHGSEANPLIRRILAESEPLAAIVMVAAVAIAASVWPIAADAADSPPWIGYGIATVGAVVVLLNLVVMVVA